jgi:hypothetical protein
MAVSKDAATLSLTQPAHTDPVVGRIGLRNYVGVGIQLALVLLLLRQYQIEGTAFVRLAIFAFAGFAIHA